MPYSPPGCNHYHSAVMIPYHRIEDCWIEEEYKSKAGVLNAGFDGYSPSVLIWYFEQGSGAETYSECKQIMNKDNKEYIFDALHECIDIISESQHDHNYKKRNRKILHWFL